MEIVADTYEYSTKELIGHGAFAVVYRGRYIEKPDHPVAIKCITKKNIAKSQSLLAKEIKILQELTELHHENVVALYHCHETSNNVFLIMEYCNGGDLADFLQIKGTLSESTIKLFLRQLADAMKALTNKGIVHRDLKPQNILLAHSGKPNPSPHQITLKIADFGFARFLQDGVMAATLCGSPMYMAPEVIMSLQYDAKADLWSLGTIVFQCLTGKAPFHAQTPQALKNYYEKNANLAPRIPPGTSEGLSQLLRGLLKRNARERMGFEEFFNHPFIRGGDTPGATPSPKEPAVGHSSSNPVIRAPSTMAATPKTPHAIIGGGAIRPPSAPSPPAGQLPPSPETLEMSIEQQKPSPEFYLASTSPTSAGVTPPTARTNLNRSPPLGATPVPRRPSPHNRQITNMIPHSGPEDSEDFVMVPSGIPSDNDPSRGRIGRITPTGRRTSSASPVHGKVAFSPHTPQVPPSTRPSQLAVTGSGGSASTQSSESGGTGDSNFRCSEPLPVPNHKETFMRMTSMGSSDLVPALVDSSQNSQVSIDSAHGGRTTQSPRSQPINVQRRFSENKAPDIASLSPPSVQFTIGTPPMGYRRRSSSCSSYSSTPPNPGYCGGILPGGRLTPTNSPLRQSGRRTPPHFPPQPFCSPPGLPPILGSPNKIPYNTLGQQDNMVGDICGNHPPLTAPPFCGPNRTRTLPELSPSHQNTGASGDVSMEGSGLQRSRTEPHIFVASPPVNNSRQMVQYGQSMQGFLVHPAPGFHNLGVNAMDPPEVMNFYAPPLNQETIMEKEHNETLAKLNFVVALVDCVLELAQSRASVFSSFTRSTTMRDSTTGSPKDTESSSLVTPIPEWQRKTEQLVLYIRALQLSSSALTLAKEEKIKDNLKPSNAVKNVVALLNQKFRLSLSVCKELSSTGNILPVDARTSTINADKLIYNYAIEMCQNAALDELFGKPEDCFRRYQTAQILLHALAQQVSHESDKSLLVKYKQAVEKRLFLLQEQGVVHAYSTLDAES